MSLACWLRLSDRALGSCSEGGPSLVSARDGLVSVGSVKAGCNSEYQSSMKERVTRSVAE